MGQQTASKGQSEAAEATMASSETAERSGNGRFGTLGVLWILYGLIRLVAAIGMFLYAGTATVMFGALLNRVADPFTLMDIFHFAYLGAIALAVACGIIGIMAGLALRGGGRSARTLGLVAGALAVSFIPLGTTLGIYTLVALLPTRTN
jgi:hypothetical protein